MKKQLLIVTLCCIIPIAIVGVLFFLNGGLVDHSFMQNQSQPVPKQEMGTEVGTRVGNIAPDFSFTTIDGQTVALSTLRGQPVIISFVLTVNCVPCKAEALNIREAQKQFPNLKVIQLGVNPERETSNDLKNFKASFGKPDWFIGFDAGLKIAELYGVRAIDSTFLINADGQIIYRDDGYPIEIWTLIQKLSTP